MGCDPSYSETNVGVAFASSITQKINQLKLGVDGISHIVPSDCYIDIGGALGLGVSQGNIPPVRQDRKSLGIDNHDLSVGGSLLLGTGYEFTPGRYDTLDLGIQAKLNVGTESLFNSSGIDVGASAQGILKYRTPFGSDSNFEASLAGGYTYKGEGTDLFKFDNTSNITGENPTWQNNHFGSVSAGVKCSFGVGSYNDTKLTVGAGCDAYFNKDRKEVIPSVSFAVTF